MQDTNPNQFPFTQFSTKQPSSPHKQFRKTSLSAAITASLFVGASALSNAATITISPTSLELTEGGAPANISLEVVLDGDGDFAQVDTSEAPCSVSGTIGISNETSGTTDDILISNSTFSISYTTDTIIIVGVGPEVEASRISNSVFANKSSIETINISAIEDDQTEGDEEISLTINNIVDSCSFYGGIRGDSATVSISDAEEPTPPTDPEEPTEEEPIITVSTKQVLVSMGELSIEGAKLQSQNLSKQLRRLRSGLRGNDFSSLNLTVDGQRLSGSDVQKLLGAGAGDSDINSQWGSFIGGSIQIGEQDSNSSSTGSDFQVDSFFAGLDYQLNESIILGGAVGYTNSLSEVANDAGESKLTGISLGLFSSYYWKDLFYADAIISYGQSDYETSREITSASITQRAKGETDGDELSLAINTGYYFRKSNHSFQIFGSVNYVSADIDAFNEQSASNILILGVDSQKQQSLTSNIGIEYGLAVNTRSAVLTPQLSLAWEHQYEDEIDAISGTFISDPNNTTFNVEDNTQDKNYLNLGLSVSAVFKGGFSSYLAYEVDLERDDFDLYDVSFGARWEF